MTSKLTRDRLQEIAEDGFLKHGESKELARMALAAMESEPVAWSNGCNKSVPAALRYLAEKPRTIGGESSFNTAHLYQLAREIEFMAEAPLYRHAQQPVVPDRSIFEKWWESQNGAPLDGWDSLRATDGYCDDGIDGQFEAWNACRAAMLQGAKNSESRCGIQTAPALDSFKKNADARCGNSPAIPEGYVMVPKEPTAEMVIKMRYHVGGYDRNIKEGYKAMLAAAPQEVNHG